MPDPVPMAPVLLTQQAFSWDQQRIRKEAMAQLTSFPRGDSWDGWDGDPRKHWCAQHTHPASWACLLPHKPLQASPHWEQSHTFYCLGRQLGAGQWLGVQNTPQGAALCSVLAVRMLLAGKGFSGHEERVGDCK